MRQKAAIAGLFCFLMSGAALAEDAAQDFTHLLTENNRMSARAEFICIRQMATADAPLVSAGTLYAARKECARYSTKQPYRSDLILADGKIHARTQHEKDWTKSGQSSKPGLTAVAGYIAGWIVGEIRNLNETFDVAPGTDALPSAPEGVKPLERQSAKIFILTPNHQELKKVVERMTVILDETGHEVRYVRIYAVGGEVITYWLSPASADAFPRSIFEPSRER